MRLVDGFSHSVHSLMTRIDPKKFYYPVYNDEPINIFLENKAGEYKMYAKLMSYPDYVKAKMDGKNLSNLFPNNSDNMMSSSNPFFHL